MTACIGCATYRVTLMELIAEIHGRIHKRIDNTWNRPVELPPIEPWWECPKEPCLGVKEITQEADQKCLEDCGNRRPPINAYLTTEIAISSAPEDKSDHPPSAI